MTSIATAMIPCHGLPGSNPACKAAAREGRRIHIIPGQDDVPRWRLVLPTYHYATHEEAVAALEAAERDAPIVTCDDDLYAFRAQGIAHKLPVGWIDPTRR